MEWDVRFKTRFAFLPTSVFNNRTKKYQEIWLRFYTEEQEYHGYKWFTLFKTIQTKKL